MISAALVALTLAAAPCTLPALGEGPRPWRAGESLEWDVDVMGIATAGAILLLASDRDRLVSAGRQRTHRKTHQN